MNALLLSDLHAHEWPRFASIGPDGINTRFADLLGALRQMRAYLRQYKPDLLLVGGDVTHRRHFISFRLYNPLMRELAACAEEVRQTLLLVGNHDLESDWVNSLDPLGWLPNASVVREPGTLPVPGGGDLTCIPYMADADRMTQAFERAPSEVPVLSHYAAEGVPLETDYWLDSPLKLGELARFPAVYFGHVHKPSTQCARCGARFPGGYTAAEPNVYTCPTCGVPTVVYVGAPLHFDFGDSGARGCLLIQGDRRTALPLPGPRFVTAKYPKLPVPPAEGGFLRVMQTPIPALHAVEEEALRLGWRGVYAVPPEASELILAEAQAGLQHDASTLRDYVARRRPEDTAEAQAALVQVGHHLLQEGA